MFLLLTASLLLALMTLPLDSGGPVLPKLPSLVLRNLYCFLFTFMYILLHCFDVFVVHAWTSTLSGLLHGGPKTMLY